MFVCMTIQVAQQKLMFQLFHYYDNSEAANIADLVLEHLTGRKRIDRIANKNVKLSTDMESRLHAYITQFEQGRPVQYILNESWFYGMKIYVDEQVLIPRPETEELVDWMLKMEKGKGIKKVADIGTGSGCIAIALKKNWIEAEVYACDVSTDALNIAAKNANYHHTPIDFLNLDVLNSQCWNALPMLDLIVSNPPYIPLSEKTGMQQHVVKHEPSLALFVQDDDPLLFYRMIGLMGKNKLAPNGTIYVEAHEDFALRTAELFNTQGYVDVEVKKDMQGKQRMIRARRDVQQ